MKKTIIFIFCLVQYGLTMAQVYPSVFRKVLEEKNLTHYSMSVKENDHSSSDKIRDKPPNTTTEKMPSIAPNQNNDERQATVPESSASNTTTVQYSQSTNQPKLVKMNK
jgi:hypothetical protein